MFGPTTGIPYLSATALIFRYSSAVVFGSMNAWSLRFGSLMASTNGGLWDPRYSASPLMSESRFPHAIGMNVIFASSGAWLVSAKCHV